MVENDNKKIDCYAQNEFYSLNRVFGFGSKNNYSISVNNLNGLIVWITGPYLIFYDLSIDKQVSFLKNINNKIISCARFSKNGKLLATGEGNCKNGEVCIYEINYNNKTYEENHKLILSNKAHKYGIDKLLFFKDDRYILSIGNNEDKIMNIIDIINKQIIYTSKFNRPILSSDVTDDFMVLSGNGFIKIYNYEKLIESNITKENEDKSQMIKRLVDLSKLKDKSFVNTLIYDYNKSKNERKIFFMTYDCYLVEMKSNTMILNRWVNLKSSKGLTITIWKNMIGCGLGDGIYRIFNAENLSHITTLQRPSPLGKANNDSLNKKTNLPVTHDSIFADIIATLYNNYHQKLITIYSDKTFYAWDINELNKIYVFRYNMFQSGGIKAMDYFIDKNQNLIKILTCSDDNIVIYWNIKLDDFIPNPISNQKNLHITYSKYIRHIFYFCKNFNHLKVNKNDILFGNNENTNNENNDEYNDDPKLTTIKFSPDSNFVAIGDTLGNVYIYSLTTFEKINDIPIHNSDVNTIDMINYKEENKIYLATGGSDNFVSVIDITKGFSKDLDIYDNNMEKMNSAVISVVFCVDKNKKLKLITAEQNSTITFFQIINNELQTLQKNYDKDSNLKTYCLSYSPSIQKIISGHNGKISIWKTSSNIPHKHFQVNKGDKLLDNFRIASDFTGVMFATSNNDKIIRVRALHDGKLLCKIPVSESISSLAFILDDNFLIATSIEGYLYFYKLNQEFIKKLQKDNDLINSTEEKNIINNKLKLLQKFMENDVSLSKNDQVKYLLDKFQKSEDTTIEDLKMLNGYVKDCKKKHQEFNEVKNPKEIQLKEDKPNNEDDQENQNNNEEKINYENKCLLSKSKIFERKLKDRTSDENSGLRRSSGRESLTDNYNKKVGISKIKIVDKKNEIPKSNEQKINDKLNNNENEDNENNNKVPIENVIGKMTQSKEIRELQKIINNTNNDINNVVSKINAPKKLYNDTTKGEENNTEELLNLDDIKIEKYNQTNNKNNNINEINVNSIKQDSINNKFSNLNIGEDSNKKFNNDEEKIKENLNSIQSSFKAKIIDNTQSQLSQNYLQNLIITQTSLGINSLNVKINNQLNKNKIILEICPQEIMIKILGNKKKIFYKVDKKVNDVKVLSDMDYKDKIIKDLNTLNLDNIYNKTDLEEIENNLDSLLDDIRIKLGNKEEDIATQKMLEKYSVLLMNKINKKLDK